MQLAGLLLTLPALVASVSAHTDQNTPCPTMPPIPSDPSEESCVILKNMDRPGNDLTAVKGPRKSCTNSCEDTTGCRTWAWSEYEGGTCWLKSRATEPTPKMGVWTTECERHESEPARECQPLKDVDFEGHDIANKPAKNVGQCCGICDLYPGCKAYAWSEFNGGTCWLKAGVNHVVHKHGVVSASVAAMKEAVCPFEFDTDFVGNDIGNKPAKNAGICCSICKTHTDCTAYSWSKYNGGTCWMKSGKGKTIKAMGVVSAKLVGN